MHKQEYLPPFEITIQDNSTWFAITEGDLRGMMFRMADDHPKEEASGQIAFPYDIAFNKMWEGGPERSELMMPKIQLVVETFIKIAMEEVTKQIEDGTLKMDLEKADAPL